MPVLTHPLPDVSASDAERILATHWQLRGTLRPLPGERERNFHVYTADRGEFVLKIASQLEDAAAIELQVLALEHIAEREAGVPVPRLVRARDGSRMVSEMVGSELHSARLLTWLPGETLAEVSPHSPALLQEIGETLGSVTRALASFRHPAARRGLKWDLAASGWIADHVHRVADPGRRAQVERILAEFNRAVLPALKATRSSVVHNDANDYNILVRVNPDGARGGALGGRSVTERSDDGALAPTGIIDFGDVLEPHPACDLAIAIAYMMMGKPDPVSAAADVVAGYHQAYPLTEAEIALLFPLAKTRLAVSL